MGKCFITSHKKQSISNKGNNKITELRTILPQHTSVLQHSDSCNPRRTMVGFLRESIHRILTALLRAKQIFMKKKISE
jgi:hypothetical protein